MNDPSDPLVLVNEMELTASELERRANRMLKLSRDLLAQAAHHATLAELPEQRSSGSLGVVTEVEAIAAAKKLGQFTRAQFADALGLKASGAARWLSKLLDREHPIIVRHDGAYQYLEPAATKPPPKRPAPETEPELADLAPKGRGAPVRIIDPKKRSRVMSVAGQGHRERQRDRRNAKLNGK